MTELAASSAATTRRGSAPGEALIHGDTAHQWVCRRLATWCLREALLKLCKNINSIFLFPEVCYAPGHTYKRKLCLHIHDD